MTTPLLEGFPPVVDDGARLLILGSFPSVQSLAARQYYGNPRNAFWPITSALFGFDAQAPYETRLAALQSHGVALWDVLHKCRRAGSSDAKIDPKSLVANDFGQLFGHLPPHHAGVLQRPRLRTSCSADWSTSTRRSATSCCRPPARRVRCRRARSWTPGG